MSDSETENIDVEFDFKALQPIDFHGIKTLLRQSFEAEALMQHASQISDQIIAQSKIGTTVKVDGSEDPCAILTVLDLAESAELTKYIMSKDKEGGIQRVMDCHRVGLVINERLINMPPQIAPPLFKMLDEELTWAVEDGNQDFDHLIFISKVYSNVESHSDDDNDDEEPKSKISHETFFFNIEDEIIQKNAELQVDYVLPQQQASDSRRVFSECGIRSWRRLLLVSRNKLPSIVNQITSFINE